MIRISQPFHSSPKEKKKKKKPCINVLITRNPNLYHRQQTLNDIIIADLVAVALDEKEEESCTKFLHVDYSSKLPGTESQGVR